MLYSSGTTGAPKGVRKPLPGTRRSATPRPRRCRSRRAIGAFGGGPGSVYLSPAPLYHAAPLVYSMSMQRLGATVVVMEHFDPSLCLELIERHRVTHAQFVPTMFVRMLRLPAGGARALRRVEPAGRDARRRAVPGRRQAPDDRLVGPDHPRVLRGHRGHRRHLHHGRGVARPPGLGRPADGASATSSARTARSCRAVEAGVVYFAGGRPFEYHNDPDKTASVTNDRGWRTLGDIGYLDEDGYLYLTDRQAHMIISGGVNIYPQEAENVLAGHPAVADVAVIGVPDPEMGEAVKAVVQPADQRRPGPSSRRSCWRTAAPSWPPTSARAASTSSRAPARPERQAVQAASCASSTGRATTPGSSDRPFHSARRGKPPMAWDFETEPEFQAKLDWADAFVREEVEPLDLLWPDLVFTPLDDRAAQGHRPAEAAGARRRACGPPTSAPSSAARATASSSSALLNEILGRSQLGADHLRLPGARHRQRRDHRPLRHRRAEGALPPAAARRRDASPATR